MKVKLLFLAMMFCALKVSAKVLSGSGNSNDPYQIHTVDDLKWMRNQVNKDDVYAEASYKLMADLDFSDDNDWIPIGTDMGTSFRGSFDGNNKVISNIKIGSAEEYAEYTYAGLFGYIQDATIINLGVKWLSFYSGYRATSAYNAYSFSGGIVASSTNSSIKNCYSVGDILNTSYNYSTPSYSAGIVAQIKGGSITNCYSNGNISSSTAFYSYSAGIAASSSGAFITGCYSIGEISSYAAGIPGSYESVSGGITGLSSGDVIKDCHSNGDITAFSSTSFSSAGGVVGYSSDGNIADCHSLGNISSTSEGYSFAYSGGIVGRLSGGSITTCNSIGDVSSVRTAGGYSSSNNYPAYAGGIVGQFAGANVTNCYSNGAIYSYSNQYPAYAGGLVGRFQGTDLSNSYSIGGVSSSSSFSLTYSGGVVGAFDGSYLINCYASGDVSSGAYSGGVLGYCINALVIDNCIGLNNKIYATNSDLKRCLVGRISGTPLTSSGVNYALEDVELAIGTSLNQLEPYTDLSGINNGVDLTDAPFDILNRFVANEKCTSSGVLLYPWVVDSSVNDGLPVLDYSAPTAKFELKGDGSTYNPFLIYSKDDLMSVSIFVNTYPDVYADKCYKLMADLDFYGENDWKPIGSSLNNQFKGRFDGNNKTIKNLKMGSVDFLVGYKYSGFFGYAEAANIANLSVEWVCIFSNSDYAAGIVAYSSTSRISNCHSSGEIYSSYISAGIVGYSLNNSVTGCSSSSDVTSFSEKYTSSFAGGIVGFFKNGDIMNCYSTGIASATSSYTSISGYNAYAFAGGIVGDFNGASIINCFSTGKISSTVLKSYSSSTYEARSNAGGIVGRFSGETISNCYSSGNILSTSTAFYGVPYSGGIAGYSTASKNINNCYATGDVQSNSYRQGCYAGGITGYSFNSSAAACIALNNSIIAINQISKTSAYAKRVGNNLGYNTTNYANRDMLLQVGTSHNDLEPVKPYGANDGDDLKVKPLGLLNKWVDDNYGTRENYLNWVVIEGVNNGNPVFPEMTKLKIEFNSNGGSTGESLEVMFGSLIVKPTDPSIEGYSFGGWYKDIECTELWDFKNDKVYSNMTLYAMWNTVSYTVSFESTQSSTLDPIQVKYGELLTKPNDPTRDGYDFAGWHKDQELTQPWDFDNDKVYKDITLYAKWNSATSIEDMNSDGIVVYSGSGKIIVKNATMPITVFSISGATVRTIQQPSEVESIDIEPGYYIVKAGGESTKVMVY